MIDLDSPTEENIKFWKDSKHVGDNNIKDLKAEIERIKKVLSLKELFTIPYNNEDMELVRKLANKKFDEIKERIIR